MKSIAALLVAITPMAALADPAAFRTCTFTQVCAPDEGCSRMEGFSQMLEPIPARDGGGWLWITEAGAVEGKTMSLTAAPDLMIMFPPTSYDDGALILMLAENGTVVMTQQGSDYDTGDAFAISYFGACEGSE